VLRADEITQGFGEAIASVFANDANFNGCAVRSEFWYFAVFGLIVGLVVTFIDMALFGGTPALQGLFVLGTLIPNLAVGARRLHDTDRSGWWQLISLVPLVGIILLIVWWCTAGTPGKNRFDV
jgi:uncharacterized membrane protein YhaH (DUF805 family)